MVYFKNIFVVILVLFCVWMLFFDTNSWLIHRELNQEIEAIKKEKDYYRKEIENDQKSLKKLNTEFGLEKFAREAYYMKRENEDTFIIEYQDSLKQKNDE